MSDKSKPVTPLQNGGYRAKQTVNPKTIRPPNSPSAVMAPLPTNPEHEALVDALVARRTRGREPEPLTLAEVKAGADRAAARVAAWPQWKRDLAARATTEPEPAPTWTSEWPTESGWYWTYYEGRLREMAAAFLLPGCHAVDCEGVTYEQHEGRPLLWGEHIPEPEPPPQKNMEKS